MRVYNLPEKVCSIKAYETDGVNHHNLYPLSNCRAVRDEELTFIVPEDGNKFVIFWEQHRTPAGVENNVYLGSYAPDDKPELYRLNAMADRFERWSMWYQLWSIEIPPASLRDALAEAYSQLIIQLS